MPLMKLGKNRVYSSTKGHAIRFVKDEEVNVPSICVRECEGIGAVFVGDSPEGHVDQDELASQVTKSINKAKKAESIAPEPVKAQPVQPDDRMGVILKAVNTIRDRNNREDFTAGGSVNLRQLAKETNFRVDKSELTEAMAIINDPD
jgi:hypothetical protein